MRVKLKDADERRWTPTALEEVGVQRRSGNAGFRSAKRARRAASAGTGLSVRYQTCRLEPTGVWRSRFSPWR
jgi:hypothetical protein